MKPNNSCYEDEMTKTPVKTYADLEKELAGRQMVDRIIGLTDMKEQLPDDVTVLVVRCVG